MRPRMNWAIPHSEASRSCKHSTTGNNHPRLSWLEQRCNLSLSLSSAARNEPASACFSPASIVMTHSFDLCDQELGFVKQPEQRQNRRKKHGVFKRVVFFNEELAGVSRVPCDLRSLLALETIKKFAAVFLKIYGFLPKRPPCTQSCEGCSSWGAAL